jgi:bacteriorhodopsin
MSKTAFSVIGFFINLFSSIAYFARVIANSQCSPGFLMLTHYRYCDYITTCPFLVLDLLWNLEAPYKW